jgi:hypothetical protein
MTTFFKTAALAALLSGASAHIIMNTPAGFTNFKVQTSPIDDGQYLFPCQKGPSFQYDGPSTNIQAGATQLLNFTGAATHAGGSCQISLANSPSADPKDWHVIHTIIGGCPATTGGNLIQTGMDADGRPDGPHCASAGGNNTDCLKSYNIPVPNVKAGNYFWAWTWTNYLGNREFYMNCAKVTVQGSGNIDINTLPSIFYSDVKGDPKSCIRGDAGVLAYPAVNVGNDSSQVQYSPYDHDKPNAPTYGDACAAIYGPQMKVNGAFSVPFQGTMPSGGLFEPGVNQPGGLAASATIPAAAGPTSAAAAAPPTTGAPAASAPAASAPAAGSPSTPATSAPAQPLAASPAAVPAASGSCANPCSSAGAIVCIGTTQFGVCNHGCAMPQPLAAGTVCQNGQVTKRVPAFRPRGIRYRL